MRVRLSVSSSALNKIVFALSVCMLLFVSGMSYRQMNAQNKSEELVRLSDRTNLELEQLISHVKDAEAGQRGYIITHDSLYRRLYSESLLQIRESYRQLDRLLKNGMLKEDMAELKRLIAQRLEILGKTMQQTSVENTGSDFLKQQLLRGNRLMDGIRSQANRMITAEEKLLMIRDSNHQRHLVFTPLSTLLISLFSLMVFVGSFLKINADRKKMTRLSEDATEAKIFRESERLYHRLIEGLPAALYTCDNDGYLQFYNKAAVELWGREPELGKERWCGSWKSYYPDGRVFPPEACPVTIALKEGRLESPDLIIERPDGTRRNVVPHPQLIFDSNGKRIGALNMLVDVTEQKASQQALEESEIRLRIATEGTRLATWDLDLVTRRIVYSPRLNEIFGHAPDYAMTHEAMREQIYRNDRKQVDDAFDAAMEYGVYYYEVRIVKPDGVIGWIRTEGKVIFDEAGTPVRMLGTLLDMTQEKEAQDKIVRSERLFKSITLNIPNSLVLVFDTSYKILTLEGNILQKMGYESSDYEGKYLHEVSPAGPHEVNLPLYEQVLAGETFSVERKSETTGDDFMLHFIPMRTDEGEIYAGLIIALDITDLKRTQDKIAMLGAIVESSDDAIVSKTLEGIVTSWNESAERIFGYSEEEMIGQPISKIIPVDRLEEEPRILDQLKNGKHVPHFETKRVRKDGILLDISLTLSPIKNAEGVIIGASKIARDITSQKEAEFLLKESEERFRTLIDVAPVLVWMSGTDKQYYFFNKSWLDFTGRTMEEESGDGWSEGVHPDDMRECFAIYSEAFDAREAFYMEYRLRRHDGEYRWISDKGIPRFSPDGTFLGYIGGCMDINDQKDFTIELERQVKERTEELKGSNLELKQQKEFAETILDTSIDITIVYDRELRFLVFNKSAELKYGLKKEEVLGKHILDVFPGSENMPGYSDVLRALDGEAIHNGRYYSPIADLHFEDFMIPLRNSEGDVYAALIIARDITETIENEGLLIHLNESLTAKNTELERSNTELASFNHVASHDLQEPLRKIQTFISQIMLKDQERLSEKGVGYFAKIQSSANRMQKLIDDLLTFSRTNKADQQRETVDLNAILDLVRRELAQTIEEKNAVITIDPLPTLEGISFQFQQLFTNLIGNALKYSKADTPPMIRVHCEVVTMDDDTSLNAPADKAFYHITVADNGIGFEPQYARQIFELFQRLHGKMEYTGTGIGLTICKKIVENHNGFIEAQGEPGKGSVFSVFLPVG